MNRIDKISVPFVMSQRDFFSLLKTQSKEKKWTFSHFLLIKVKLVESRALVK